jgi:hypothetical protein
MKQPNKFNSQLKQEILESFRQLVKALIKTLLEALMLEEKEIYLEEAEDYANCLLHEGFNQRTRR